MPSEKQKSCEECGNISHSNQTNSAPFESKVLIPEHKNKITNPYVRDVFMAYLTKGADRTVPDGFPIIEKWMVAKEPPLDLFQWDCRHEVTDPSTSGMSFYCKDENFTPVLNNPHLYIEKLRKYQCVVGMDASPYDNMPQAVQISQVYANLQLLIFSAAAA